jgi:uncharacterized protein (DUF362 family)
MSGHGLTRRELLAAGVALGAAPMAACRPRGGARVFAGRATSYERDLTPLLLDAFAELGIDRREIAGRRILLKPNLVEARPTAPINTHPQVVRAAAEAFRRLGAAEVRVGEGPGHCRDTRRVLEASGLAAVLREDGLRFLDLNRQPGFVVPNAGGRSGLTRLTLPQPLAESDWLVSVAKMKTHHWAGVTLSMKNLFGVMPGAYYGWPKNVLHYAGLGEAILDIAATVRPQLAIIDGIVGMEGDGPIMGEPRDAGVLLVGRDAVAVDASAARVMGIDPGRVRYLAAADGWLGPIGEAAIEQVGERLADLVTPFRLVEAIPARQGIAGAGLDY